MTQPATDDPCEGQTLDDRFRLRQKLGAGNFGTVWLADQMVFDMPLRPVALKLFRGTAVTPQNARVVLNDAIALVRLQQEPEYAAVAPYLVGVYDAGLLRDRGGQAFVAMEFVDGFRMPDGRCARTLQGLIRAFAPVPVELVLRWAVQALRPIAWMHTLPRPVLHCDLKPDNILAAGNDSLKVVDFGLAQLTAGTTGVSAAVGALTCQAPETLSGLHPTAAVDVYGLGLILYEMVAGRNPLLDVAPDLLLEKRDAEYRRAQIRARADGLPPLGDCGHPEIRRHPLLVEIVNRCLRFKASERYDNAAAVLREVERYNSGQGVTVLPAREPPAPSAGPTETLERLLNEAELCLRDGDPDAARRHAERARERFPTSGKPYRWLAEAELARGRVREAIQLCAQGRKVDPNDPDACEAAAKAYDAAGNQKVAAMLRDRAVALRREGGNRT